MRIANHGLIVGRMRRENPTVTWTRFLPALMGVFVLSFIFIPLAAMAQGTTQISISPLALPLAGQRGETIPFSISIVNGSTFQTTRFEAFVTGLGEGREGNYTPIMPDDGPFAASPWIQLEQNSFEVRPGAAYELRGTVTIPRTAPPSGYAAVVIELKPEARTGDAALSVEYRQQFVAALEIVVGDRHVRSAHIDSMTVVPSRTMPELRAAYGDNAVLFIGSLLNDGDVHVTGQGSLIIRDERGRRVRDVPLGGGRGVVLPGATVDFVSVLRGLAPGNYEMQAVVNYGGLRPAIGRMEFELGDEAVGASQIVAGRAVRIDAAPVLLQYDFPRQGYRAQTITVVNQDNEDVDFTVTLEEFVNDEDGQPVAAEPGVILPYSAVPWAEVRPSEFTLRPGQRRNVVVGFRTPEGESGGRYARIRIEGQTAAPEPGAEAARSEIIADALLVLGTEAASHMELVESDWQPMGASLAAGATIVNKGDIHGAAGLRLTLLQFVPGTEEERGDFIVLTSDEWEIVDSVQIEPANIVLLPEEQRFIFGVFDQHTLETERQYQVLIEALEEGGLRSDEMVTHLWIDAGGTMYEGVSEQLMGADE